MNIMWRASSLESKTKGDLRRDGVHKDHQSSEGNGDRHSVFRNSTSLLGHVMHDHQTHVSTNTNTILKTLKVKHYLLGRVKQRRKKDEEEYAGPAGNKIHMLLRKRILWCLKIDEQDAEY